MRTLSYQRSKDARRGTSHHSINIDETHPAEVIMGNTSSSPQNETSEDAQAYKIFDK